MEVPDRIRCQICGKEVPDEEIFPSAGKPLSEFAVGYYQISIMHTGSGYVISGEIDRREVQGASD